MLGGALNSASKRILSTYNDHAGVVLGLGLFILILKTYIVQFSYNRVWPRLSENNGNTPDDFKPLSFYESFLLVVLFTFLI
jgi:hypothetical protein